MRFLLFYWCEYYLFIAIETFKVIYSLALWLWKCAEWPDVTRNKDFNSNERFKILNQFEEDSIKK